MKIAYMPDTHFGVYDAPSPPSADEVADAMEHCLIEAELAEKLGFDGIWVPERHQRRETWWPNTITYLTALAARTSRVQLATAVMQPTYHHPVHLAEQLAAIDNLARGRLAFGAGVGYHEDYFRHFGVPFAKRGKRFEETLDVINGVWTEEEFSYNGEFFNFDKVRMTPKPFQRPRPPIWIGAFAPIALERALDWDGWITWFPPSFDELRPLVEEMREKAAKRGKQNWTVGIGIEGWVGDEPDLRELHGHRWVREYQFYAEKGLSPETDSADSVLENLEAGSLCLGNRQHWLDKLGELKEKINPDWVCIRTRTPQPESGYYPGKQEFIEVIERFADLLPEIRRWQN